MSRTMLRVPAVLALAVCLLAGCKSEGEKKYDEAKELDVRGMQADAIKAYEEAASLMKQEGGEPGRAYEKLGGIYKKRHELDKAIDYYRKAIADDPADFDRYAKLIGALRQAHRFDEARKVHQEIKDHPDLKFELKAKKKIEDEGMLIDPEEKAWKAEQKALAAAAQAAPPGESGAATPSPASGEPAAKPVEPGP